MINSPRGVWFPVSAPGDGLWKISNSQGRFRHHFHVWVGPLSSKNGHLAPIFEGAKQKKNTTIFFFSNKFRFLSITTIYGFKEGNTRERRSSYQFAQSALGTQKHGMPVIHRQFPSQMRLGWSI